MLGAAPRAGRRVRRRARAVTAAGAGSVAETGPVRQHRDTGHVREWRLGTRDTLDSDALEHGTRDMWQLPGDAVTSMMIVTLVTLGLLAAAAGNTGIHPGAYSIAYEKDNN